MPAKFEVALTLVKNFYPKAKKFCYGLDFIHNIKMLEYQL